MRSIAVSNWRWQRAELPRKRGDRLPEYAPAFDDSNWNTIKTKTDADTGEMPLRDGETAVYRAHFTVTEEDLKNPAIQLRFAGCDDHGWYFVNNQRVGESHDWEGQPLFDIKNELHPGDNVIAVGVKNDVGEGGLNPNVNLEIVGKSVDSPWSRSLFSVLDSICRMRSRVTPNSRPISSSGRGRPSASP